MPVSNGHHFFSCYSSFLLVIRRYQEYSSAHTQNPTSIVSPPLTDNVRRCYGIMSPFSSSARPQSTRRLQDQVNNAFSHKPSVTSSSKTAASEGTATPSSKAHSTPASEEEEFKILETSRANREYYDTLSRDKKKEYEAYCTLKYHLDGENWIRGLKKDTTPDSVMKSNLTRIRYLQAIWDLEHGKSDSHTKKRSEENIIFGERMDLERYQIYKIFQTYWDQVEDKRKKDLHACFNGGDLEEEKKRHASDFKKRNLDINSIYDIWVYKTQKFEEKHDVTALLLKRQADQANDIEVVENLRQKYDDLSDKNKNAWEDHYKQTKYGNDGRAWLKDFKQGNLDAWSIQAYTEAFAKVDGKKRDIAGELLEKQEKAQSRVSGTVKKPTEMRSSTKVTNQPLPNADKSAPKTGGGLSPYEAIFDVKVTEKDYQYVDGYPTELTRPMKPENTKPSTAKSNDRKKLNDTQLLYEQYDSLDRKGKKDFENHYKQAKYGDPGRAFLKVFKQRDLDNRILRKNMDYFAKVDGYRWDFMSELLQSQKKANVPAGDTTSGG